MASKEELQRFDTTILAAACQEIADNPAVDNETAEKAWHLKREWVLLQIRRTPPPRDYKSNDELVEQEKALGARIADFLSRVLQLFGKGHPG